MNKCNDEYYTPRNIVNKIYNEINISLYGDIWLPFDTIKSNFVQVLNGEHHYLNTHINYGYDFLKFIPPFKFDLLISNPPYSILNNVLMRCFYLYDLNLINSFCLLVPLSILETETRANLLDQRKDKISVFVFKKRIKFINCQNSYNRPLCLLGYNLKNKKGIYFI